MNMSHAVDGGVQPTVACRRQLAPLCQHWLLHGEGRIQKTAVHDRLSVCRLILWRCSSHDSLTRWPASPTTSASSPGTLETVDSGALLCFPRFLQRCFWTRVSRCHHRLTTGQQRVVVSRERGHAICLDWKHCGLGRNLLHHLRKSKLLQWRLRGVMQRSHTRGEPKKETMTWSICLHCWRMR